MTISPMGLDGPGFAMTFVTVIHCDIWDTLPDEMYTGVDTSKTRLRMTFFGTKTSAFKGFGLHVHL